MARHALACLLACLSLTGAEKELTRWSRQISTYTSDLSDWVPLPRPVERESPPQIKRQAVAEPRILSEPVFSGFTRPTDFGQDVFPSRNYFNSPSNRQLYLQSVPAVPSAPQNYLTDQGFGQVGQLGPVGPVGPVGQLGQPGQSIRFGLSQPNFPLNQAFVGPQFPFDPVPNIKPKPQPANPIRFENFPKSNVPLSPQAKPFNNQAPKKTEAPKFVDGYRVENVSNYGARKPQSLQKIKFENVDKIPYTDMIPPNKPKSEREEVQLLYVPLESLNKGQFNLRPSQHVNSDQFVQRQSAPKQTFSDFPRPVPKLEMFVDQDYYNNYNSHFAVADQTPKLSTLPPTYPTSPSTTPKPKKLKPHQPPLAIFLTQEAKKGTQVKVGDVLSSLKNAASIAVLDSVNPQTAPKVFIGPNNLNPPENFVKFELPYLSNIDHSEKKIRQLPFFVAPLSYNTPQGFAKIPFPAPHVGSVVINSQIKEPTTLSTPAADVIPNSYSTSQYRPEPRPVTPKPTFTYFSTTAPKTNQPPAPQPTKFYSFEPQTVSTVRPLKEPPTSSVTNPQKTGSYFLGGAEQYDSGNINYYRNDFQTQEPVKMISIAKIPEPTTTTTTAKPSTYPSQLLETHNPYSINQAFHFSTPLDYHSYFEENYATGLPSSSTSATPSPAPSTKPETVTQKQHQSTPNFVQNYSPEIHYESEVNSRYPAYSNDYTTKSEASSEYQPASVSSTSPETTQFSSANPPTDYSVNTDLQTAVNENSESAYKGQSAYESESQTFQPQYSYGSDEESQERQTTTSTTTTPSTTTTRRTPLRTRGRPRYTTSKPDSAESSTKTVVTRRPLRERRPLPSRPRYEPNRITTERATRKPVESNESTTKYTRTRTRGRVQFKPTDNDEYHGKTKSHNTKEDDIAYQRDVLHQNYPVTILERASTHDIEAITEPTSPKISSTKNVEDTEVYDTENAYSYDRASFSQQSPSLSTKDDTVYTPRPEIQSQTYVPSLSSTREEYNYQSRSSLAPIDAISSFDETAPEKEEDYVKVTTPTQKNEKTDIISYATESISSATEENLPTYAVNNDNSDSINEDATTIPDIEITKISSASQEVNQDEQEENVVQTTPSYNRVRVRPGVVRQYHQPSSTESTRMKIERRRPVQAVTYRPAFDRRRTTMRIEEIEADLKTKQVHSRPDAQEHRHPIYRPEPTTDPGVTPSSSSETTTKKGVFRRRRPTYTTTSTEASSSKRTYEVKNRFRGRRPTTEKPTDKPEVQTETPTSTVRNTFYSRYSNRPRLSDRYNKKPEPEESDDQDSNYSINRPKYIEADEQWSPKVSSDSFKPYNPNDIVDDIKTTTEHKPDEDEGLDIITARNEYEDILISVTPATNNRLDKKIPDIPPTLEALVEQSKTTKSDPDTMSTFESMLEEVMKSLDEQDEDEYTKNVMKHKGGEIGEIPPERIISSGDNYQKQTTMEQQEATTVEPTAEDSTAVEDEDRKSRRRGFWKKVKVRPVTETIEAAESQYYANSVNQVPHTITLTKAVHDKSGKYHSKISATTYKPALDYIKDMFNADNDFLDVLPTVDIPKIGKVDSLDRKVEEATEASLDKETPTETLSPGDMDLGTGSPDPVLDGFSTEATTEVSTVDRADAFSFMDYLFGMTTDDKSQTKTKEVIKDEDDVQITTELPKPKIQTTENTIFPEEITFMPYEEKSETHRSKIEVQTANSTEVKTEKENVNTTETVKIEASSESSFMNPSNVVSTSMSTEVSHETEICFRGKCIKTNKDVL